MKIPLLLLVAILTAGCGGPEPVKGTLVAKEKVRDFVLLDQVYVPVDLYYFTVDLVRFPVSPEVFARFEPGQHVEFPLPGRSGTKP